MSDEHLRTYSSALTIAGSDSGGGAGVQADLKTFSALGCYGMSAITALTAQNTEGVQDIFDVSAEFVGKQIDSVMDDIGADAVKIGMLHDPKIIETVAGRLDDWSAENIVLDPVMVAQSGDKLIKDEAVEALTHQLFPRADVITPNLPEAERILNRKLSDPSRIESAAKELLGWGPSAVLIKGGHSRDKSRDCLALHNDSDNESRVEWLEAELIDTTNTHGTGCTLSSAIAASLAQGQTMYQSLKTAKRYITGSLKAGKNYRLGRGAGPPHHFYQVW